MFNLWCFVKKFLLICGIAVIQCCALLQASDGNVCDACGHQKQTQVLGPGTSKQPSETQRNGVDDPDNVSPDEVNADKGTDSNGAETAAETQPNADKPLSLDFLGDSDQ
ncbi:MAG: hypothetical protein LBD36_02250 [Holosporales bacterium]|jgi:hypothetical protein|nr:hypothetical protein [Holosporales bacterium]